MQQAVDKIMMFRRFNLMKSDSVIQAISAKVGLRINFVSLVPAMRITLTGNQLGCIFFEAEKA